MMDGRREVRGGVRGAFAGSVSGAAHIKYHLSVFFYGARYFLMCLSGHDACCCVVSIFRGVSIFSFKGDEQFNMLGRMSVSRQSWHAAS